ncbi:MAG: hypothetical protein RL328_1110 [Acidobacteriota bacterium]
MNGWRKHAGLALMAACFVAAGLLFIPRMGIEVDEALVGSGIYPNSAPWFSVEIAGHDVPVMLMSHLGAIKALFYAVLFQLTPPRPMSLRLPTLLVAAGSLWVFFAFLERAISRRAAWVGTFLLATDTSYTLMNAIDYGPVTLQLLFKLSAVTLGLKFHQSGRRSALAGAFLCLGLGLWDKAIFGWVLVGLAVGVMVVFPREAWRHVSVRNVGIAAGALLVGAAPLVLVNILRPLETLRSNAHREQGIVWGKAITLARSLDGDVFFGHFFATQAGPHNLTLWATVLAVAALPWLWQSPARRPMLFALVSSFVTWVMMAYTAGAGAAAQHVLLLWPFQFVVISAALDQAGRAAGVGAAVVGAAGLALTGWYFVDVVRNGPSIRWTDAMDPLQHTLEDLHAPRIYVADWGLIETMQLQSEGRLPIQMADLSSDEAMRALLNQPEAIFVGHAAGLAIDPHQRATLEALAQREQFVEEPVTTVYDRNGRPAFDVFRFRKLHL